MINKIEFSARNLTSNAGLLLLLEMNSYDVTLKSSRQVARQPPHVQGFVPGGFSRILIEPQIGSACNIVSVNDLRTTP